MILLEINSRIRIVNSSAQHIYIYIIRYYYNLILFWYENYTRIYIQKSMWIKSLQTFYKISLNSVVHDINKL